MSEHHHHHHKHSNFKIAFFLNLSFTVFEIIGGIYTNSVAIISDAIHDFGDSISIGIAWYLHEKSHQEATKTFSFGYRRFSLFGALINCTVLITGSFLIIAQAISRIITPEHSHAEGMFFFALFGITVNGYAAWKMSEGDTLNEKIVTWHLIEDVLGWVAILIVSIILYFKDIHYLDPALSILISSYILWNVFKRLKETIYIFLQGQPKNIDREQLEKEIMDIFYVKSLHDTHIWSLDGEHHIFSTHVKLKPIKGFQNLLLIKKQLKTIMKKYPFEKYTIETELDEEDGCKFDDNKNIDS